MLPQSSLEKTDSIREDRSAKENARLIKHQTARVLKLRKRNELDNK